MDEINLINENLSEKQGLLELYIREFFTFKRPTREKPLKSKSKILSFLLYVKSILSRIKKGDKNKEKIMQIMTSNNALLLDMNRSILEEDFHNFYKKIAIFLENCRNLKQIINEEEVEGVTFSILAHKSLRTVIIALESDNYENIPDILNLITNFLKEFHPETKLLKLAQTGLGLYSIFLKILELYNKGVVQEQAEIEDRIKLMEIFYINFDLFYDKIAIFPQFAMIAHLSLLFALKINESAYNLAKEHGNLEDLKNHFQYLLILYVKIVNRLWIYGNQTSLKYMRRRYVLLENEKSTFSFDNDFTKLLERDAAETEIGTLVQSSIFFNRTEDIDKAIKKTTNSIKEESDESKKSFLELALIERKYIKYAIQFTQNMTKSRKKAKKILYKLSDLVTQMQNLPELNGQIIEQVGEIVDLGDEPEAYPAQMARSWNELVIGLLILVDEGEKETPNLQQIMTATSHIELSAEYHPLLVKSVFLRVLAYCELAKCYEKLGKNDKNENNLESAKSHFELAANNYNEGTFPFLFTIINAKSNLCSIKAKNSEALLAFKNQDFKRSLQLCESGLEKLHKTQMYLDQMKILDFLGISPLKLNKEFKNIEQFLNDLKDRAKAQIGLKRKFIGLMLLFAIMIISIRFISNYLGITIIIESIIQMGLVATAIYSIYRLWRLFTRRKIK